MKKVVLVLIITGSALLVTGGAITAIGYAAGQGVKIETQEYENLEAFDNINADLTVAEFEIKPSTDGTRKVVVDETRYDQHTVEVKDNALSIKGVDKRKWYEHIFNWSFGKVKVTVYMPTGEYDSFKVKDGTGSIIVPASYTFNTFEAKVSTGSVKSSAIVNDEVKIETSTGSTELKDVTAKKMSVKSSTGSLVLKNVDVEEDITANASTGSIVLESTKCHDLTAHNSTGSIRLTNVLVTNHIEASNSTGGVKMVDSDANTLNIKTSSGSVNLTLLSDKVFYATSNSGSVKVPKSTTGGMCEIHTSSGSIRAEIKNAA